VSEKANALAEFLLARIAEDEAVARAAIMYRSRVFGGDVGEVAPDFDVRPNDDLSVPAVVVGPERLLAECEAKRRIVEQYAEHADYDNVEDSYEHATGRIVGLGEAVRLLAEVYGDHPDYREEWRP
jgi:hypothetical protein